MFPVLLAAAIGTTTSPEMLNETIFINQFPMQALRHSPTGMLVLTLSVSVSAEGKPTGCAITEASASVEVDAAACV